MATCGDRAGPRGRAAGLDGADTGALPRAGRAAAPGDGALRGRAARERPRALGREPGTARGDRQQRRAASPVRSPDGPAFARCHATRRCRAGHAGRTSRACGTTAAGRVRPTIAGRGRTRLPPHRRAAGPGQVHRHCRRRRRDRGRARCGRVGARRRARARRARRHRGQPRTDAHCGGARRHHRRGRADHHRSGRPPHRRVASWHGPWIPRVGVAHAGVVMDRPGRREAA